MRNQEAGNTLGFLWHKRCRFYFWEKMGKKHTPYMKNPAMTASTYVKHKVGFFMEKKRE